MKKLLIIIFIAALASACKSQDELQSQYNLAQELFKKREYFDAVTELKRLNFFDSTNQFSFQSCLLMGKAHKAGAMLNDAVHNFTMAGIFSRTDEEFYEAEIELIRVNILRRTSSQAHKIIDRLLLDERFISKKDELNYWKGWAYIFEDDWVNAADLFSKVSENHELTNFCDSINDQLYSATLAKLLSVFIPGAGQIYTGNYLNGIFSLGWNVFAGWLSINSFAEERIFDGLVAANFLWLRFYIGGINNAQKFAEEKNLAITNNALDYLQHKYGGLKP